MDTVPLHFGKSVTGKLWCEKVVSNRDLDAIAQRYDLPAIVAKVLCLRGVTVTDVPQFLHADIKTFLPDPDTLKDIDILLYSIYTVVKNKGSIGIVGDYDVDGAASIALLARYLRSVGVAVHTYVPDRLKEGYGPNIQALHTLHKKGCALILCVDCGTTAFDVLKEAKDRGIPVAIIDHHMVEGTLPECVCMINPKRMDDFSSLETLCTAGLVFCVLVGLHRYLKQQKYPDDLDSINLLSLLDLVALATVCDVVPLTGLNRAFVRQGLKVLRHRQNIGLRVLADSCRISGAVNTHDLGFVFGPRINAGGRIGNCALGAQLLMTNDTFEAKTIVNTINVLNTQRQSIEEQMLQEALQHIQTGNGDYGRFICVCSSTWHAGVIGIVAGRLKDMFDKPVIVISFMDTAGKGSGRSIEQVDLGALITRARQIGILQAGGGHKMAVGISIKPENVKIFCAFLKQSIDNILFDKTSTKSDIVPYRIIDSVISLSGITVELCNHLSRLEPFGAENAEPRFVVKDVMITSAKIVGQKHISMYVKSVLGGAGVKAICFKCVGTVLGKAILDTCNVKTISLSVKIKLNSWNGTEKAQMVVEDLAI